MDRALESDRTACSDRAIGLPPGNVVAEAGNEVTSPSDATLVIGRRNAVTQPTASPTLDTLFKRNLARQPDALALVDPINKLRISGQQSKRLTFAQADRMINSLAAHF